MNFRQFYESKVFTGLKPDDIEWWAKYARNQLFSSPQEAHQWLFDRLQHADKQSQAAVFGIDGPDYNKAYADAMPVYQSGKSWKIGKRIRNKSFSWKDVDIRANSLENLTTAGYVNPFDNPELGPINLIQISKLYKTENHSEKPDGQAKIAWLLQRIKDGEGYFKAIVYGPNGEIIDGHHRYEVAIALKMKYVPAQLLTFDD